jgi:hypothetical protein
LMGQSHCSLRDDYEVSCAELDLMVGLANHADLQRRWAADGGVPSIWCRASIRSGNCHHKL